MRPAIVTSVTPPTHCLATVPDERLVRNALLYEGEVSQLLTDMILNPRATTELRFEDKQLTSP